MRPKAGTLILAGLALVAVAHMASVDASEPRPRATVRVVVKGLTSGGTCVLRLAPNGIVQGGSACRLSPAFAVVKRWRRDSSCVCLLDNERRLVLAFRATSDGAFRATGETSETLELRLMAATSQPSNP
jgi:hypothetical protein